MELSKFTRIFTLTLLALFVALSACFVIGFSEYLPSHLERAWGISFPAYAVYALGIMFCAPCVAVLVIALKLSEAVKNDTVFTKKSAKIFSLLSAIILSDCLAFLGAVALLFASGELTVAPLLGVIGLVGIGIGVMLRVLSEYIRRAAELKEEADATL